MRGDKLESVRRRNLSTVLELVHQGRAQSRAELTASTGLNRSTIAALVAELAALGLVNETAPTASKRVGRPSPRVVPDPGPAVIAVNPELDAITVGVVGLNARVEHRVRREVDHAVSPEEAVAVIAELTDALRTEIGDERRILGVGLAVPGLVRAADGVVRWAPHLGWRETPITRLVEDAVGLPASADNDASLAAGAERIFGVGRGVADLVYLNGGASGIGGGVIVRGIPLGGVAGYAGEFGQNRPGLADAADRATEHGTLEDEVSRARLLEVLGLHAADELEFEEALLASREPKVLVELERQQRILAVALSNAINVLNPELVVLGGFLASVHARDPEGLELLVQRSTVPAAWEGVRIRRAALAQDTLLIGAAELAFAPLLRDPAGHSGSAPTTS
ncbi:ROK family protein [Salinibacterium sp. SYSU T00001]|uniref:ROK family protein n=1 Tax=Homoserinimonas sedimenticola TaxID=2986805 RepID=UPI0022367B30|nr:ROK family protein [Salinibacterium sedimenticola]MCW4385197.1 ROK family protein [Salinibacterium sedimenticola]